MKDNLFIFVDIPKIIQDIPNEGLKNWLTFCYTYKITVFIFSCLLIIIPIITFFIGKNIDIILKSPFKFMDFKGKKNKKANNKDNVQVEVVELNEYYKGQNKVLENKLRVQSHLIEESDSKIKDLIKTSKFLKKIIEERTIKLNQQKEQIENNENIINGIKENYSKIEEIVNKFSNAAYNLTENDNNLYKILTLKKLNEKSTVVSEVIQEIFYNISEDLPTEGKNLRISLMKYIPTEDSLKIIAKFGNFNCNTGDIVLKRGEGLAGNCLELKQIINIGDVNKEDSYSETAISMQEYIQPIRHYTASSLHIPIWVFNDVVAVLNLTSASTYAFSAEDVIVTRLYSIKISLVLMLETLKKK